MLISQFSHVGSLLGSNLADFREVLLIFYADKLWWWAVPKICSYYNFAIPLKSQKSRKFDAHEIYVFCSSKLARRPNSTRRLWFICRSINIFKCIYSLPQCHSAVSNNAGKAYLSSVMTWRALKSFQPGLCCGAHWGSLQRSSKPSSLLGRGISPPETLSLRHRCCLFQVQFMTTLWKIAFNKAQKQRRFSLDLGAYSFSFIGQHSGLNFSHFIQRQTICKCVFVMSIWPWPH